MATTQTSICNQALDLIGEQPITAISDDKPRANALNREYEPVLREVLGSSPWTFARKRVELTQNVTPPIFGWKYQYTLPGDFIHTVRLNGVEVWENSDEFEIEGGSLLTNEASCQLQYVFYQTDTSKFSALFTGAFATLLAARCSAAIRQDGAALGQALEERYFRRYLPKARMKDGNQRKVRPYNRVSESNFIRARRASTRG